MKLDEIVIDMKTRKEAQPPKELTMLQAFGSHEMNVLHDAGIKLAEKPDDWNAFEGSGYLAAKYVHPMFTVARAEKALGGKFKVYTSKEIYGGDKPSGPLANVKTMPEEHMFIVDFGKSKYLADRTGARTYIRNWAKIE
jgi:hypothetical protein